MICLSVDLQRVLIPETIVHDQRIAPLKLLAFLPYKFFVGLLQIKKPTENRWLLRNNKQASILTQKAIQVK